MSTSIFYLNLAFHVKSYRQILRYCARYIRERFSHSTVHTRDALVSRSGEARIRLSPSELCRPMKAKLLDTISNRVKAEMSCMKFW